MRSILLTEEQARLLFGKLSEGDARNLIYGFNKHMADVAKRQLAGTPVVKNIGHEGRVAIFESSAEVPRTMLNLVMKGKLERGEAVDISKCKRTREGRFLLEHFDPEKDYCDATAEVWIWSIGIRTRDDEARGEIHASFTGDLYQNPDYKCLWLR